jgi:hypothetical protein
MLGHPGADVVAPEPDQVFTEGTRVAPVGDPDRTALDDLDLHGRAVYTPAS